MKKLIKLFIFLIIVVFVFIIGRYSANNQYIDSYTYNEYDYYDYLCKIKYKELKTKYVGAEVIPNYWKQESEKLKKLSNYFYKSIGTNNIEKDSLDSFSKFMKYYVNSDSYLKKILNTLQKGSDKELKLKLKILEYIALNKMIEDRVHSYFQLDQVGALPYAKKDTIKLGQEYFSNIFLFAYNTKFSVVGVLENGDTLHKIHDDDMFPVFKETPLKRGWVKHKGSLKLFHYGEIRDLPFEIEYYVK